MANRCGGWVSGLKEQTAKTHLLPKNAGLSQNKLNYLRVLALLPMVPQFSSLLSALVASILLGMPLGLTEVNVSSPTIPNDLRFPDSALEPARVGNPSPPSEGTLQYDLSMQAGYAATQARNYREALEHFRAAQLIRPQDIYARQAIFNVETYETLQQQKLPMWWWVLPLIPLGLMGGLGLFFWHLHRSQQRFLEEVLERRQQFQPLQDNLRDHGVGSGMAVNTALPYPVQDFGQAQILSAGEISEGEIIDSNYSTQLPEPDIIQVHIDNLADPLRRQKAIWALARQGDSRAVRPLVGLMTNSDAQERSLILEALSQISGRTLKPMNQALALSLQDRNPEVRKNAVRDLSRLYDVMSQISQLLTDATYDQDQEVQETAKWALSQLNAPRSPS